MKEEIYGYVYKVTNNINGKIYVGQHKSTVLDESYWGSGVLIRRSQEKYGLENFTIEILEWCSSKEDLDSKEIYWIKELNSTDPAVGYNIGFGGRSCGDHHGELNPMYGKKHSAETLEKMRESKRGKKRSLESRIKQGLSRKNWHPSETTRARNSESHKGEKNAMYGVPRSGKDNPWYRHHHTEEARKRISEAAKNRVVHLTCQNCGCKFSARGPRAKLCSECKNKA